MNARRQPLTMVAPAAALLHHQPIENMGVNHGTVGASGCDMDNVSYIGLSRQAALQRQMDIVANNLANVDTVGFKVEQQLLTSQAGAPTRKKASSQAASPSRSATES